MRIKKQRFYYESIAIDIFYNPRKELSEFKQAAVVINGFPDNIGINALTTLLVSTDVLVFQPHMAGTYDSGHLFSPTGAEKTFMAVNNFVNKSIGAATPNGEFKKMLWNIKSVILIGHSFGGFFSIRYFHLIKNLKKAMFTSSVFHYKEKYGCLEDGPEQYSKVTAQYPYTYRLSDINEWQGMWEGKDAIPCEPKGSIEHVLVIYGEKDKYFNVDLINKNITCLIDSYVCSPDIVVEIASGVGHPLIELLGNLLLVDKIKAFIEMN